nr:uncharacterized protein LOC108942914 [Nicotiana tomentosiformis]
MYICFQALKLGYKQGLRPFIGLDGTFLKGEAKWKILLAVRQDNMNQFYHIAWVVVDKETKRSWTWFMELLKNSLELNMGEGVTFMSDMQKELLEAIKTVLPDAKQRYFARYVEANRAINYKGLEMKKLFWWSA